MEVVLSAESCVYLGMSKIKGRQINVPRSSPPAAFSKVLLGYIIAKCQKGGSYTLPRRDAMLLFNRVGGRAQSALLKQLCTDNWLKRTKKSPNSQAYTYSPGPKFKSDPALFAEWTEVSKMLFGYGGLLKPFIDSPAWAHRALGPNGIYVLAILLDADSNVHKKELNRLCEWLMSTATVKAKLEKLQAAGLVSKTRSGYSLAIGWEVRLQDFENKHPNARRQKMRVEHKIANERERYIATEWTSSLSKTQKLDLKKYPCIKCGEKAAQVEHFPPRKFAGHQKQFCWPICIECNKSSKQMIQRLNKKMSIDGDLYSNESDIPRIALASLEFNWRRFCKAVEAKDEKTAYDAIQRTLSVWEHIADKNFHQDNAPASLCIKRTHGSKHRSIFASRLKSGPTPPQRKLKKLLTKTQFR